MKNMDIIYEIKLLYVKKKLSIRQISKELNIARQTIKKIIDSDFSATEYSRRVKNTSIINEFESKIIKLIEDNKNAYSRLTAKRIYTLIKKDGYTGSYDTLNNFINNKISKNSDKDAFIPQYFAPGEAAQFDFGTEYVVINGLRTKIKVVRVVLCYSNFMFVYAYPNEQLEMVLDAHGKAFKFFNGIPNRMIYDNMKTIVTKVLLGKNRKINDKYLAMASFYLFEHTLCTPNSGWEKGKVERAVSTSRDNFFIPVLEVESFAELNKLLIDNAIMYAKNTKHTKFNDKTIYETFLDEQKVLNPFIKEYDSFRVVSVVVNKVSQIQFETNLYSIYTKYVEKVVNLHIRPNNIDIYDKNEFILTHQRSFDKHKIISHPFHYLECLLKKPGALRNGAPFKDLNQYVPPIFIKIRDILGKNNEADRQYAKILQLLLTHDITQLIKACEAAIAINMVNIDVIIYYLTRANNDVDYQTYTTIDNDCTFYSTRFLKEVH